MKYSKRLPGGWIARVESNSEEEVLTIFHPVLKREAYFVTKAPELHLKEYKFGDVADVVIEGVKSSRVIFRVYLTFYPESAEIRVPRVRRWMKQ
jgi:hypothetical protein